MAISSVKSNPGSESDDRKNESDKNHDKECKLDKCVRHMKEIHDFYVKRLLDSTSKQHRIVAAHQRSDQNDVNTTEIDHKITRYQREPEKHRNGCTVRIPSMFWFEKFDPGILNDLIVGKGKFSGSKAIVKKQWGSHIFVNNGAEIQTLSCFLNEKHEYSAQKPSDVNCVYPVLRNFTKATDKPELVLGSRFCAKTDKKGDRSFGKDIDPQDNADGVWDITEEFFDTSSQSVNYMSEEFTSERRRYAFYVCEDSRLIVTDDRAKSKDSDNLTRSFYQQGSLLVIEVDKGNQLVVGPEFYAREKKQQSREDITEDTKEPYIPVMCKWKNLGKKGFLEKKWFNGTLPEDERDPKQPKVESNDRDKDKDLTNNLNEQRRVVIFLGATESQHNTVCWRLEITSTEPKEYILRPPDGGRIIDIQTWIKGFEQIIARHRYQRLFEAVLYPEIHSKLAFSVPEDEKLFKRILGMCDDTNSLNPLIIIDTSKHFKRSRHPQYFKPEFKGLHRMAYVEGVFKRDDWKALHRYSVQPLNPPLQMDSEGKTLLYLRYGVHPVLIDDKHYKIEGKDYEIHVKQVPEYSWKLVGRVSDFREQFLDKHSAQHRIGIDWMVYETNLDTIGHINSAVFYPKQETEEVTPIQSSP